MSTVYKALSNLKKTQKIYVKVRCGPYVNWSLKLSKVNWNQNWTTKFSVDPPYRIW